MSTKHNSICLQKAGDDEPIFVLRAKDPKAPDTVRYWISENQYLQPEAKLAAAADVAHEMELWLQTKTIDFTQKHHIDVNSVSFGKLIDGSKSFEVSEYAEDFIVGDVLVVHELKDGYKTGWEAEFAITSVELIADHSLCVMGLRKIVQPQKINT